MLNGQEHGGYDSADFGRCVNPQVLTPLKAQTDEIFRTKYNGLRTLNPEYFKIDPTQKSKNPNNIPEDKFFRHNYYDMEDSIVICFVFFSFLD
jgi:hypothetical protein